MNGAGLPPPRQWRWRLGNLTLPLATLAIGFLAWEWAVVAFQVRPFVLPRPSAVAVALVQDANVLVPAALATAQEIVFGFLLAVAIGVALAIALVSARWAERAFFPLLVSAQLVPKVALAPLLTIWLGLGMTTKLTVAFLLSFFPILIDTMIGLKSVEMGQVYLARSMGAGRIDMFLKIRLPSALPNLFGGMKVASTLAVVGAIVGEFIGANAGLGNVLLVANSNFDMVMNFAGIAYLTVIGMILFAAIDGVERLMIPWHVSHRARGEPTFTPPAATPF
jgi:NitT/TauT family transport system permease protein